MGREIRNVPPNWEHPRYTEETAHRSNLIGEYVPMFDGDYQTACEEWLAALDLWRSGKSPDQNAEYRYYWDWNGGPPDKTSYREHKWSPAEASHFQVYETVSEGTPVTPHFATKQELIEYLCTKGDFWGNKWSRQSAERFVQDEWAPSGIAVGGKFYASEQIGDIPEADHER